MWLAQLGAPFLDAYGHLTGKEPLYTSESLEALRANDRIVREKALEELDYRPRPIEETVADVYRSFSEHGRIPAAALAKGELEAG